jgi:prepilin peptidase CpaA
MIAPVLIIAPFVVLLLLAAGWDLTSYTIPNFIPAALLLAFAVYSITAGYTLAAYEHHALAALLALVAGFLLFSPGFIGGGDAKLFTGIAIWFGMHDLLPYILLASVFGGAFTLALLAVRRWPLPQALAAHAWINRLHEPRGGIPYGVALSAAALAILPHTELLRSVAA